MLTQLPELLAEENRAVALTRRGKPVLALMPWELFQSVIETLEIMGDAEMMDALRQGIQDVQEGNIVSLDEVKAEVGNQRIARSRLGISYQRGPVSSGDGGSAIGRPPPCAPQCSPA